MVDTTAQYISTLGLSVAQEINSYLFLEGSTG